MKGWLFIFWLLLKILFGEEIFSQQEEIVFPHHSGIINVKSAPYFAKGDGITDDTKAIQKAINDNPSSKRLIYLPSGTYLISDTLQYSGIGPTGKKRTTLQGAGIDKTTILLKENASGYQNRSKGKPMIYTGEQPADRFGNEIRDLTINKNHGNPGAIGLQFMSNNWGTVCNVKIISPDTCGLKGLDMSFTGMIGPLLIRNVEVIGFDTGVCTMYQVNSQTFENITLRNQQKLAWYNLNQHVFVRKLYSYNSVPVISNPKNSTSDFILMDSFFEGHGNASGISAINNENQMYIRNLKTKGYKYSMTNSDKGRECLTYRFVTADTIEQLHSHCRYHGLFDTLENPLSLAIKEIPNVNIEDTLKWKSVMDYGAIGDGITDDSKAIQAAIASGTPVLYFNGGKSFLMNDTVDVFGSTQVIRGLRGNIKGKGAFRFIDQLTVDAPIVIIENMMMNYGDNIRVIHDSKRTLVVNNCHLLLEGRGKGDFFINDVCTGAFILHNPSQHVYCRQLNIENYDQPKIQNRGSKLWILGLKTENDNTVIYTSNGGCTELVGAFVYNNKGDIQKKPMFVIDNANASFGGVVEMNFTSNPYKIWVKEIRNNDTMILTKDSINARLFVFNGYTSNCASVIIDTVPVDTIPDQDTIPVNDSLALTLFKNEINAVWPIPASQTLYVKTAYGSTIEFLSTQGILLQRLCAEKEITTIDVSDYNSGFYFILIYNYKHECTHYKVLVNKSSSQ